MPSAERPRLHRLSGGHHGGRAAAACLAAVATGLFCLTADGGVGWAAAAPSPDQKLKAIEKALEEGQQNREKLAQQAEALDAELAGLRSESVSAARAAQEHETAISDLEERLEALRAEETGKVEALKRRQEQQAQLLMALERLARHPPEALALEPGSPIDSVRRAMLLSATVPHLAAETRALKEDLAALEALRARITENRDRLAGERSALEKEQSRLAGLIGRKAALQTRAARGAEASAHRVAALSQQAGDLRDLIERLEAERKRREEEERLRAEQERRRIEEARRREAEMLARAMVSRPPHPDPEAVAAPPADVAAATAPPPSPRPPPAAGRRPPIATAAAPPPARTDPGRPKSLRSFAAARGAMVFPASGRVSRRYGEAEGVGMSSKGLTIQTRSGAQVVAPFEGRVEFAGPFRGYGQILIIEHGDGYHSLLAGLDRIDGAVGQWLVAGEPVGVMKSGGGEAKPALYIELRHHGQPIDPGPWLAPREDKGTG